MKKIKHITNNKTTDFYRFEYYLLNKYYRLSITDGKSKKKWKLQCLINSNNKNLVPSSISGKKSKEKVKLGTSHSTNL